MRMIVLLLLVGLAAAGDWDHIANAAQSSPSVWSIMNSAVKGCPGAGESRLCSDAFMIGMAIVL